MTIYLPKRLIDVVFIVRIINDPSIGFAKRWKRILQKIVEVRGGDGKERNLR